MHSRSLKKCAHQQLNEPIKLKQNATQGLGLSHSQQHRSYTSVVFSGPTKNTINKNRWNQGSRLRLPPISYATNSMVMVSHLESPCITGYEAHLKLFPNNGKYSSPRQTTHVMALNIHNHQCKHGNEHGNDLYHSMQYF